MDEFIPTTTTSIRKPINNKIKAKKHILKEKIRINEKQKEIKDHEDPEKTIKIYWKIKLKVYQLVI